MSYHDNKKRAVYTNTDPTLTDQSAAHETDLTVIVSKFLKHGTLPQRQGTPIDVDLSELPTDFRDMIHLTRELGELHKRLPEQLRNLKTEQLLALTPDELKAKLAPVETPKEST